MMLNSTTNNGANESSSAISGSEARIGQRQEEASLRTRKPTLQPFSPAANSFYLRPLQPADSQFKSPCKGVSSWRGPLFVLWASPTGHHVTDIANAAGLQAALRRTPARSSGGFGSPPSATSFR